MAKPLFPHFSISVHDGLFTTVFQRSDTEDDVSVHTCPVAEIAEGGTEIAAQRLGQRILGALLALHRDQFARTDMERDGITGELELVHHLVRQSARLRTSAFIGAIDRLLSNPRYDLDECISFRDDTWVKLRAELAHFPP
jgi:hypothetical protein